MATVLSVSILDIIAGGVLTFFVSGLGYFKWWHEVREKKRERAEKLRERAEKEKVQKELDEIRRRGEAPYLVPSESVFNFLYHDAGRGKLEAINCGEHGVLCAMQAEVQKTIEDGDPVVFVVENTGQGVRACLMKLDGENVSIHREAQMQGAQNNQYFVYPYRKNKHGELQKITLSFECGTGVQDTHTYETRHGMRWLRRIDPPLLNGQQENGRTQD